MAGRVGGAGHTNVYPRAAAKEPVLDGKASRVRTGISGQSATGAREQGPAIESLAERTMRTDLCTRVRDRRGTTSLVAGTDQREQSAHAQMRGVQFGIAAAKNLGLLQAAQCPSGGGNSCLGALAPDDHHSRRSYPDNESDDRWLAGRMAIAVGNGYSSYLRSRDPQLSEKSPFFDGLLGVGVYPYGNNRPGETYGIGSFRAILDVYEPTAGAGIRLGCEQNGYNGPVA